MYLKEDNPAKRAALRIWNRYTVVLLPTLFVGFVAIVAGVRLVQATDAMIIAAFCGSVLVFSAGACILIVRFIRDQRRHS